MLASGSWSNNARRSDLAGLGTSLRGSICIYIILYWWKLPERLQTHERLARLLFKGREVLQDNFQEVFRVVFVGNFQALEFSLRVREEDLDGRYQDDLYGGDNITGDGGAVTDLVPPADSLVLAVDDANLHNRIPVLGESSLSPQE